MMKGSGGEAAAQRMKQDDITGMNAAVLRGDLGQAIGFGERLQSGRTAAAKDLDAKALVTFDELDRNELGSACAADKGRLAR